MLRKGFFLLRGACRIWQRRRAFRARKIPTRQNFCLIRQKICLISRTRFARSSVAFRWKRTTVSPGTDIRSGRNASVRSTLFSVVSSIFSFRTGFFLRQSFRPSLSGVFQCLSSQVSGISISAKENAPAVGCLPAVAGTVRLEIVWGCQREEVVRAGLARMLYIQNR